MTKHMRIRMEGMDRGIAAKRFMTVLLSRENQFRLTNWVNGIIADISQDVKRKLEIGRGKIGSAQDWRIENAEGRKAAVFLRNGHRNHRDSKRARHCGSWFLKAEQERL